MTAPSFGDEIDAVFHRRRDVAFGGGFSPTHASSAESCSSPRRSLASRPLGRRSWPEGFEPYRSANAPVEKALNHINMAEPMTVVAAIHARHSVRQFGGALAPARRVIVDRLVAEAAGLVVPFGTSAEIGNHGPGLGTLGGVSNEAGWLMAKIPVGVSDPTKHQYDAAFRMHYFVLKMTQHGFATVWIAGSFNGARAQAACPEFTVPGVVAYGEDAQRRGYVERFVKWITSGKKPVHKIFFDGDAGRPFTEESAGVHGELMRAVLTVPSALNKQPWRFLVIGNVIHLYTTASREVCRFDMGIAIATMSMLVGESGRALRTEIIEQPPKSPLGGTYVVTCTIA